MARLVRRPGPALAQGERALLALGSNLGDRVHYMRKALTRLLHLGVMTSSSFLYESAPMYNNKQPPFLNAVVELTTTLQPAHLLSQLQRIEADLGRERHPQERNTPRTIDLDIVLYGSSVVDLDGGRLTVPHPRMHERPFVVQPICDIDPARHIPRQHSRSRHRLEPLRGGAVAGNMSTFGLCDGICARDLLAALGSDGSCDGAALPGGITRVSPLRCSGRRLLQWDGHPKFMGIVNATPDSFSDGGQLRGVHDAVELSQRFAAKGFEIVDIGGQSTRPGAPVVPAEVEKSRIAPVVEAVRERFPDMIISVDTFRSEVAASALDLGADIINDVSAGGMDPAMVDVVREKHALWVQMHMRGTPATMMSAKHTHYGERGVVRESAHELSDCVEEAVMRGVPRWDIVVDPGVGFAKTAEQSATIVRGLAEWNDALGNFPCLVGISRKSSLARLVPGLEGAAAVDRDFATAGAAVAAVHAGADIVRVHNPAVADAVRAASIFSAHNFLSDGDNLVQTSTTRDGDFRAASA